MTEQEVIELLKQATIAAGGQKAWSVTHGFSPAFVNDVLLGRRQLTDRLLAALGVERVVTYRLTEHTGENSGEGERGGKEKEAV